MLLLLLKWLDHSTAQAPRLGASTAHGVVTIERKQQKKHHRLLLPLLPSADQVVSVHEGHLTGNGSCQLVRTRDPWQGQTA